MEAENNIDDLLVKYFFNECTASEKIIVLQWIQENSQHADYFSQLRKTVELLMLDGSTAIDTAAEWQHLQRLIRANATAGGRVPYEPAIVRSLENFSTQEPVATPRNRYGWLIPAAAAILAIIYFGGFFSNQDSNARLAATDSSAVETITQANAIVHHEINNTSKVKFFALPDGSQVTLSVSSELTYSEPAGGHKRNVFLKGEAMFAVAKDKTKPFIVFSGDISTMAVGTRFTVTNFDNDKFIQVKLEEGKVLVKSENTLHNKLTGDFYLLPGQQLTYDKALQTAGIKFFSSKDKDPSAAVAGNLKTSEDKPELPQFDKNSWFMFNNQSLAEIFHSLERMYDVKIEYTKRDVDQRYFIGTFSKSDSVETILHQIAVLNKLIVTKRDNTFIIQKNQ